MALYAQTLTRLSGGDLRRARLALVERRDREADGLFWYSVVTTGIYCRPSCPSRRARPEHIRFHDSLDEARRTGFRPCLRCRPEGLSEHERQVALIARACGLIEGGGPGLSSQALAEAVGLSRSQFHRVFRRVTGVTPFAYASGRRSGATDVRQITAQIRKPSVLDGGGSQVLNIAPASVCSAM